MRRFVFRLLPSVFCLLLLALGCATKEPRYPADHARFERIDVAVENLRKAYAERDLSAFQTLLLPSDQIDRMELDVGKDFDAFTEITLDLSIERIFIEGETIDVYVHWQGLWKRDAADTGQRERGHGMLRLQGVHSILLQGFEGDVPFGMFRRAPAEPPKGGPS